MSMRTRAEVGVLLRKAQDHLRKAQELHADLQELMHRLAHEGIKNKRGAAPQNPEVASGVATAISSGKPTLAFRVLPRFAQLPATAMLPST